MYGTCVSSTFDTILDHGEALARKALATIPPGVYTAEDIIDGDGVSEAQLPDFVRDNAWGHHASCTCRIGRREDGGVLTKDFEVHGVTGLRVVDASVFPRIPGFFIVSAIYMIGEKAADVIGATAKATPRLGNVKAFSR